MSDHDERVRGVTGPLALAGILTGAAGAGTAQATVWLLQLDNGPVDAVAAFVRDHTPGGLAHWLIERVGHWDKPLLLAGTGLFLLVLCAVAGVLARTRTLAPDAIYFVLGVIGLLCVLRLDDDSVGEAFAVLVGVVTWIVVHRLLTAPLVAAAPADTSPARRDFLRRAGGVVVVAGGASLLGWVSGGSRRKAEKARSLLRLPIHPGAAPEGAGVGVRGIAPWRTPNDRFYLIDTTLRKPAITPSEWTLRIHGMVERELTLTYRDLVERMMPTDQGGRGQGIEDWITLCCVSNEVGGDLIGNAYWSGVPVRDLLSGLGIDPAADAVLQTSKDGWTCGTPLSALTDPGRNAMLALGMNGKPLPIEHGFPVRMVVPGLFGYVSATKWLVDLEITTFDQVDAYWTKRGWAERGPVLTQSRIDVPRSGDTVAPGTLAVGGCAWAQHTGIAKVEYQLDGGAWRTARLGAGADDDTWVQWTGDVQVDGGEHTLVVRATDKSGYTQTAVRTDVIPSGATGWHTISFDAG